MQLQGSGSFVCARFFGILQGLEPSMKAGTKVKMSHPGKRDGEVGVITEVGVPIGSHHCNPCECGVRLEIEGESWLVHRNFVEPIEVPRVKKCSFIEVHNVTATGDPHHSVFVPRPTSFFGGWARHQWLKSYFKKECSIASPDFWET